MFEVKGATLGAALLIITASPVGAQVLPTPKLPPLQVRRPQVAEVIKVGTDSVTVRNATGSMQTFVVSPEYARTIKVGMSTTWCEDDCRVLPLGNVAVPVKRIGVIAR